MAKLLEEFRAGKRSLLRVWIKLSEINWVESLSYCSSPGKKTGLCLPVCILKSSLRVVKRSRFSVVYKGVGFLQHIFISGKTSKRQSRFEIWSHGREYQEAF